jgi:hypothetical protein
VCYCIRLTYNKRKCTRTDFPDGESVCQYQAQAALLVDLVKHQLHVGAPARHQTHLYTYRSSISRCQHRNLPQGGARLVLGAGRVAQLDPMHYGVLNAISVDHGNLTLPALTRCFVAHTGHEKHQLPE